jgi:membrane dipeptidase
MTPIFDGHNDSLLRLALKGHAQDPVRRFIEGEASGHIDLPRARRGGLAGGLFAMFAPSPSHSRVAPAAGGDPSDFATGEVDQATAWHLIQRMLAIALRIEQASNGEVTICRSVSDIQDAMRCQSLAVVLHIEGAEAIDRDFEMLDILYAAGLRSLGPVWSRPNSFGHGVPFLYPSSPDTGPGLTDLGKELVRACNRRKIMVDVSHLNEKGFWDVAAITDAPIVATHSNVHSLSAQSRNLTGRQLDAIAESGGLVGLNFAVNFLREDGARRPDTPPEEMLRHLDRLIETLGEDGVALGSDFDGATMPQDIGDAAGLPALVEAMYRHGYGEELVQNICWRNWLSMLARVWASP